MWAANLPVVEEVRVWGGARLWRTEGEAAPDTTLGCVSAIV
jgi:hypothetical protein